MPSLRFSYPNRPNLTLYSGLAVDLHIKHGREYIDDDIKSQFYEGISKSDYTFMRE